MAKTIKFNLICDAKPVRTIEDLQNNFSIEDVLTYYKNKLLQRWLEVRGYTEELEKVKGIIAEKPIEITKELIKIFHVVSNDKKVEESVYMLEFLDERKVLCSEYEKQNYKVSCIIDDYQDEYTKIVDGIFENPDNMSRIKANIEEITNNYAWILELDHRALFWRLRNESFLAIMCLLMNRKTRNFYLPVKKGALKKSQKNVEAALSKGIFKAMGAATTSSVSETEDEYYEMTDDKAKMYQEICSLVKSAAFKESLGDNLLSFAGITDGYWKDLEPKGKKYMIIRMGSGDYVRSAGISGGDLSSDDILNKFMIVDGIDYKSNSATSKLLYMEV